MPSFHITAFDERTGRGFLRHVLVKRGFSTGEVMVVLVAATPVFPGKNHFLLELRRRHPEITTIVLNINKAFTSMVLGDRETVLYGPGYIRDKLCGMTFRISPRSFYQINPVQTHALYTEAIRLCALTGKETVLDAYCGTGTIGMIASRQAAQVIGVELNPDAVKDAKKNARENKVDNIRFFCADAGDWMRQAAEEGYMPQVVLMDPPRAGCSRAFLQALLETRPERIVFVLYGGNPGPGCAGAGTGGIPGAPYPAGRYVPRHQPCRMCGAFVPIRAGRHHDDRPACMKYGRVL